MMPPSGGIMKYTRSLLIIFHFLGILLEVHKKSLTFFYFLGIPLEIHMILTDAAFGIFI
jgi:hypothetical protein